MKFKLGSTNKKYKTDTNFDEKEETTSSPAIQIYHEQHDLMNCFIFISLSILVLN